MKRQKDSALVTRSAPVFGRMKGLLGTPKDVKLAGGDLVTIPEVYLRRIGLAQGSADGHQLREEFRHIKRPMLSNIRAGSLPSGNNPRIIMVTSGSSNEGKTFIAQNLALSLGLERNMQVTLIDADIATHSLSDFYGLSTEFGLLDMLHDPSITLADTLQATNVENLSILPVGERRHDSAELLAGDRFSQVLNEILQRSPNQVIVLDSPAVLAGSAAITLAERAGQLVFVVASNESRRVNIDESLRLLNRAIAPMEGVGFGFVLNKTRPSRLGARYTGSPT
ncbi:MAG: P-loop NTPase [Alphaproteobacteria bacterium]